MAFTWLQLSDLHATDRFTVGRVCDDLVNLCSTLPNYLEEFGRVSGVDYSRFGKLDCLFFTGDLVQSGGENQFSFVSGFLKSLVARTDLKAERVFVVPGNHDVDRALGVRGLGFQLGGPPSKDTPGQVASRMLDHQEARALLTKRFSAYDTLASEFPNAFTASGETCRHTILEIDGHSIAVLSINTAWLCKSDDRTGSLIAGHEALRAQLITVHAQNPDFVLLLMHHAPVWLIADERIEFQRSLQDALGVDAVLCGHDHRLSPRKLVDAQGEAIYLKGGALFQKTEVSSRCTIGYCDPATGRIEIFPLTYSHTGDKKWTFDRGAFPSWSGGVARFQSKRSKSFKIHNSAEAFKDDLFVGQVMRRNRDFTDRVTVCLFADAKQHILDQIDRIVYSCSGGKYANWRWISRCRHLKFSQSFQECPDAKVTAQVFFLDGSSFIRDIVNIADTPLKMK